MNEKLKIQSIGYGVMALGIVAGGVVPTVIRSLPHGKTFNSGYTIGYILSSMKIDKTIANQAPPVD